MTQPTEIRLTHEITVRLVQSMGGDAMVVAAAKVSTSGEEALSLANLENQKSNAGLINYLLKHRHGTPFEHASMTLFVHAPAFVWWAWTRHRIGFSYNLESGRYKELEPVFWIPKPDRKIRPSDTHKPARPTFVQDDELTIYATHQLKMAYAESYRRYAEMVNAGVANEVARAALPFAVYYSGWVTCNPRSIMAFLSLRTHEPDATFISYPQEETEQAARATEQIFKLGWPDTYIAFNKNGRVGP